MVVSISFMGVNLCIYLYRHRKYLSRVIRQDAVVVVHTTISCQHSTADTIHRQMLKHLNKLMPMFVSNKQDKTMATISPPAIQNVRFLCLQVDRDEAGF